MPADFVHLHAHSEYSLLDGMANVEHMTKRAAELGMDTLALTDHGVVYGAIDFYKAAKKAGIKPIIGCEVYVAPGRHTQKNAEGKGYFHTVLLAKNMEGYHNLVKLSTKAHLDGYYYRPRIDREMLLEHKEGLIVTQACLSGEVNKRITQRNREGAREAAAWYRDMLGPEHYYLELQLHPNVPELHEINEEVIRIGKELGIPLVATNDVHYVDQADADAQRMLMALGFNMTMAEFCAKNPIEDDSYFLKTPDQMAALMAPYPRSALDNTRRVAEMCNLDLEFGRVQLPDFPLPEGHTPSSYLHQLSEEGLLRRLGNPPPGYWERLQYELDVIDQTGFPLYMLIVWDFVKFARTRSIPCLPRGSAGGSLVLYCLGITDVDPVANKLVFERFLNPERKEMPDIDMDFADSRRNEVIDYVTNKYGRDRTAQIITFGTLGAKAALRDVGRVLSIPLNTVDQVAKLVPKLPIGTTLSQSLERVPELKKMYEGDGQIRELIDKARKVEGVTRNFGTHACGVVVAAQPLDELVPLQHTARGDAAVMTAFPMGTLGEIGLLKMDVLGLTNLSIVDAALQYVSGALGRPFTLADIPPDDMLTLESLSRGNTLGVFQLESPPMTRYLKELRPTRIDDIYAMVALYRPGPMAEIPKYIEWKNNPHKISYLHPVLKPILEDTYGVIVYQEQVLAILMQMAGYTMGKADIVRKAIGKKNAKLMAEEEPRFLEGSIKNGLSGDQAHTLWSLIQPFAGYSFNRAHSTLYGLLSYQTAFLKTHYPAEYMAALLSSSSGNLEDIARYVGEAARLDVAVSPPDVNASSLGFTIEPRRDTATGKGVRFGLSAIKGVGEGPIRAICAAREADGRFTSLEQLCERVDRKEANKRVFEALIKCGATGDFAGTRQQQLKMLDSVLAATAEAQRMREAGQFSMFDLLGSGPSTSSMRVALPAVKDSADDSKQNLLWEKELLGMYVSDHPFGQALAALPPDPNRLTLGALGEAHVGQKLTLIGMLIGLRKLVTKKGETMLSAQFEDLEGAIDVVAFPKAYERYSEYWLPDNIVALTGRIDNHRDALQLIIDSVAPLSEAAAVAQPVVVDTAAYAFTDPGLTSPDLSPDIDPDLLLDDEAWRASLASSEPAVVVDKARPAPTPPVEQPSLNYNEVGKLNKIGETGRTGTNSYAANATPNGATNGHASNGHAPNGATNGHTPNGAPNGHAPQQETPPATPQPPPSDPQPAPTVIRPRQRITIAKKEAPSNATAPVAVGPQRHLHVTLPRTGNDDADVRCMQEVNKVLGRFAGTHKVTIYVPQGANRVLLEPIRQVEAGAALVAELNAFLGEGAAVVEGM